VKLEIFVRKGQIHITFLDKEKLYMKFKG